VRLCTACTHARTSQVRDMASWQSTLDAVDESRVHRFAFAVLELKLASEQACAHWVGELAACGLLQEVVCVCVCVCVRHVVLPV
jgi:SPX domain protein involved in polyphosphate accumulation